MKKLLSILFILSSPAFAIDKPIPCDGANCKLKFETRDGSNVKVSAGEVSGTGAWVFGPSGGGALATPHQFRINGNNDTVSVRNYSTTAGQSYGLNVVAGTNASDYVQQWVKSDAATSYGKIDGTGAWTIGPSASTASHNINGGVTLSGYAGFFKTATQGGGGSTCTSACAADDGTFGFDPDSGGCLGAWINTGVVSACGTTLVTGVCLCIATK
jgi:hypothetical protein